MHRQQMVYNSAQLDLYTINEIANLLGVDRRELIMPHN